jgi:hypothetical protein
MGGNGFDAKFFAGTKNTQRNFATVRYQDFI